MRTLEDKRAEKLPPVLLDPAWAAQHGYATPAVFNELETAAGSAANWLPGERESWADTWLNWPSMWADPNPTLIAECVSLLAAHRLRPRLAAVALVKGEAEQVRPLLARWKPTDLEGASLWMRVVVARFGSDAVPPVLAIAHKNPALAGELLAPLTGPLVAAQMADWLVRVPAMRAVAEAWLSRHPAPAADALVPVAVAELGPARAAAGEALRLLAGRGEHETVLTVARRHGPAVAEAVATLLATDQSAVPPAWLPTPPKWLDPVGLPPVLTRDGQPLPADCVRVLCGILCLLDQPETLGRIPAIKRGCDQATLAEFGWTLLEQWQAGNAPGKDAWVVTAVGLLGDDGTVGKLVARIVAWAESGRGARAVKGLEALGAIGSDVALMHVERLSRTSKVKRLKRRAGELLTDIARDRGLDHDQLADRVVPHFGLDSTGSMVLDYGPRRFTVGFDEQLKPWVADENGARRALLPRPSANDDQGKAPAAYEWFATLKKDVRAIATEQIRRLERAMVDQRRWSADEFRALLVGHPLLWHLARRLVWASYDGDGPVHTFRVAEDRSFADVDDDEFVLDDGALVGVIHPVWLGEELSTWSEVFGDYEILQPFPQLGRGVFGFEDGEVDNDRLDRFAVEVPTGKVLGLRSRGWQLAVGDGGDWDSAERAVGSDRVVRLSLAPGIPPYYVAEHPKQQVSDVRITTTGTSSQASAGAVVVPSGSTAPASTPGRATVTFGDLDPLTAYEVLRDLLDLTA